MKKLNKKGFTLIELLAVIVIMGILMLVAIPAISRTILNSRRSTFANTALQYVNSVKNAVAADEVDCGGTPISSMADNTYYIYFDSSADSGKDLLEQGGKSSWSNNEVQGYVIFTKDGNGTNRVKYTYSVSMVDGTAGRMIAETVESGVGRTSVVEGSTLATPTAAGGACTVSN